MFRKLLSNLSFNPSLITQVAFYAKRMHREEALRRSGLVLVAFSMILQTFAVLSPAQASVAGSGNDIIYGGFSSPSDAANKCRQNVQGFFTILAYYQIDCNTLAGASTRMLNSREFGGELDSLGRRSLGPVYTRTGKPTNEYEVPIGGTTYIMKNLWAWDSGPSSSYKALEMKNKAGQPVFILYSCANVVTVKRYYPPVAPAQPVQPAQPTGTPKLEISKTTIPGYPAARSSVAPGTILGYRINFKNTGNGTANYLTIEDRIPEKTVHNYQGGFAIAPGSYTAQPFAGRDDKAFGGLPAGLLHNWWAIPGYKAGQAGYVDMLVKVTDDAPDGYGICNHAFIRSNEVSMRPSNEVCHYVKRAATPSPPPPITPITTVEVPLTPQKPCDASTSASDTASCLKLSKAARNNTQNVADANNTTAAAGNSITYTLTVKNTATVVHKGFVIEENLGDVMEYVETVTDMSGGSMDNQKVIRWPAVDIPAGGSVSRTVTIQVKKTIPSTPTPPSDPASYDLIMTNVYGNAINIKLPGAIVKIVETTTTTTLPNTGPGENMAIMAVLTVGVSYFFARSRLMAKELDIVREEYASVGSA